MRFHKRAIILSILCCFLIYASGIPAFAEDAADAADEVQTYYTLNDGIIEAYIYPDASWEQVIEDNEIRAATLYTQDGSDRLVFLLTWNEAEFDQGMQSGQEEFTVNGSCIPDLDYWSQYDRQRWEDGKIKVKDDSMRLHIHVRPKGYAAGYRNKDELVTRKVRSCTPFEDVKLYDSTYLETDSPYDPVRCSFQIEWSREEYEKGIESGARTFLLHGRYTECRDQQMQKLLNDGWIQAEGTEDLIIEVEQRPTSPKVYYDPYPWTEKLYTTVSRDTPVEELNLPASGDLELRGGDDSDGKTFAIRWSREDYAKGIASGAERFSISGEYTSDCLDQVEKEWWDAGLITMEGGRAAAEAIVTVARDESIPFSVSLHLDSYEDKVYPKFSLINPGKVSKVIFAVSIDGINWSEFDAASYLENYNAEYCVPAYIYDENDRLISIPADAPSYYKMMIEGGPFDGESAVVTRNPPSDLTDEDDDISGDRGGGGQGEHDRPDKDDPLPPVQPPVEPPQILPQPEIPMEPPAVLPPPSVEPPAALPPSTETLPAEIPGTGGSPKPPAVDEPYGYATEHNLGASGISVAAAVRAKGTGTVLSMEPKEEKTGAQPMAGRSEGAEGKKGRMPAFIWGLTGTAALMAAGWLLARRRRKLKM